ncbi:putative DNA-binding protein [Corynebacterium jeikeium]|uniref:DNA-binding protein n=1 Tax=Corynebacterium jeikeium (strain K411) TaxID=306537 RepID=Q4JVN1_CORJK|nr:hypothetical protein [Corynebacterium jeikeium]CAI37126.1 hypothetical protein jk0962 [Corynebacterium jeikeium K411]SUY85518.1 putative DNA-binding protein [Corynebacterium jeikeium]
MFAVYAAYRGRSQRRGEYVRDVAAALERSSMVESVEMKGIEDFVCIAPGPDEAGGLVMSLLQAGDFALGIGSVVADVEGDAPSSAEEAIGAATRAVTRSQRAGAVSVRIEKPGPGGVIAPGRAAEVAQDIAAAFTLLAHVLARRTKEGREATALLRAGHLQAEAAEIVGISKQAMSQRLAAAGWHAEQAGWTLAVHMLARADELKG